jgi:hypothetical protein
MLRALLAALPMLPLCAGCGSTSATESSVSGMVLGPAPGPNDASYDLRLFFEMR